jgi:hypothetical protein
MLINDVMNQNLRYHQLVFTIWLASVQNTRVVQEKLAATRIGSRALLGTEGVFTLLFEDFLSVQAALMENGADLPALVVQVGYPRPCPVLDSEIQLG